MIWLCVFASFIGPLHTQRALYTEVSEIKIERSLKLLYLKIHMISPEIIKRMSSATLMLSFFYLFPDFQSWSEFKILSWIVFSPFEVATPYILVPRLDGWRRHCKWNQFCLTSRLIFYFIFYYYFYFFYCLCSSQTILWKKNKFCYFLIKKISAYLVWLTWSCRLPH